MRKLIAALGMVFSLSIAYAQNPAPNKAPSNVNNNTELLNRLAAQLDQHAVVRADFVQSKQVAALKRPLLTNGRMVFSKQYGVLWQIDQPYRMSYVLGEDKVVEIAADGTRHERLAKDLPGLAQIGRVFRAMLGANTAALREYFDIKVESDTNNKWMLQLTPRQSQLAQFIAALEISGSQFVSSIRVDEASGDNTQIKLRNSVGASSLQESEQALFTGSSK